MVLTRRTAASLFVLALTATGVEAQVSPGPLAQAHAHLDSRTQCFACHGGPRSKTPIDERCAECHAEITWELKNRGGLHGTEQLQDCSTCHPDHAGRDFDLIDWSEGARADFDHARSGWPLAGRHRTVACAGCHTPKFQTGDLVRLMERKSLETSWIGLDTRCASCHDDLHRGTLGPDCGSCHAETGWLPTAGFDHASTDYPLDGAHVSLECKACHTRGTPDRVVFSPLGHDQCSTCHTDTHTGQFGPDCASCHVTSAFKLIRSGRFNHAQTAFPLRGKHQSAACAACHEPQTGSYKRPGFSACASCHADAHAGQARWDSGKADCGSCHNELGFKPATLTAADHDKTRYPLAGAHRALTCGACHLKNPQKAAASALGTSGVLLHPEYATCRACHDDAHAGQLAHRPNAGACENCHTVTRWTPSEFGRKEHAALEFRLDGVHADTSCRACHGPRRQNLRPLPHERDLGSAGISMQLPETRCADCHFDPHATSVGERCDSCHSTTTFRPSTVDAEGHSGFEYELRGAHRTVPCVACHAELTQPAREIELLTADSGLALTFSLTRNDCASCHASPHAGQFRSREQDCGSCHGERAFVPAAGFSHDRETEFPLQGEHSRVACAGCHAREQRPDGTVHIDYTLASRDCKSCHGPNTQQLAGRFSQ